MKRPLFPILAAAVVILISAVVCVGCDSGVVGGTGDTQMTATTIAGVLGSTSTTLSSSSTSLPSTTLGAPPTSLQSTTTTEATTTTTAKVTTTTKTTLGAPPQSTTTTGSLTRLTVDIGTVVPIEPWTRYEEKDSRIEFQNEWLSTGPNGSSGDYFAWCPYGYCQVRFRFQGTRFRYVAQTEPRNGYAKITVDDSPVSQIVDLYSLAGQVNKVVYTSPLLDDGVHVVVIEWTGQQNAAGQLKLAALSFDAVDVKGTLIDP
jgi:hypothetical protein